MIEVGMMQKPKWWLGKCWEGSRMERCPRGEGTLAEFEALPWGSILWANLGCTVNTLVIVLNCSGNKTWYYQVLFFKRLV